MYILLGQDKRSHFQLTSGLEISKCVEIHVQLTNVTLNKSGAEGVGYDTGNDIIGSYPMAEGRENAMI